MPILTKLTTLSVSILALSACATVTNVTGSADPDAVAGDYLQGRFAASQQNYDDAARAFDRAASRTAGDSLAASAFQYALAAGDFDQASIYARDVLSAEAKQQEEEGPLVHSPQAANFLETDLPRMTLIGQAFRAQNYAEAEELLQAEFNSTLGQSMGHLLRAWAINGAEGPDAGIEALQTVPENIYAGFAPLHQALMIDMAGDLATAEDAYQQAMSAPGADLTLIAYGGFLERHRSKSEALKLYSRMSEDRGFIRRVGRMGLVRLGEPLPGESREFKKVSKTVPLRLATNQRQAAAIVFLNYAWSAYEQAIQRQQAAARAGFEDLPIVLDIPLALAQLAVLADQDLGAAHYVIGAISGYNDQYDMAAAANSRVKSTSWLYNYAAIDRADAYVQMGNEDRGIELIQDYLRQDALAPDVELTLADLLTNAERYEEAEDAATKAIEIAESLASDDTRGENLWRFYFARGVIRHERDNWPGAEKDLRVSLELSPEEPMLLNYLGYSYVDRGENIEEAFGMIEKALEERPSSGAITDSLGWAYYQMGDYDEAVRYLEKAVTLEPGDVEITDHLGDAYWQSGRTIEARYEWRRVLEIEGLKDKDRTRVEAKLAGEAPAPGKLLDHPTALTEAEATDAP